MKGLSPIKLSEQIRFNLIDYPYELRIAYYYYKQGFSREEVKDQVDSALFLLPNTFKSDLVCDTILTYYDKLTFGHIKNTRKIPKL